MYSNNRDLLIDIQKQIAFIESTIEGVEEYTFYQNELMKRGIERSLEIIGEASNKLSKDIRDRYTEVNWRDIIGIRNIIIHHYKGIDYTVIWDTIKTEIPLLKTHINIILQDIK